MSLINPAFTEIFGQLAVDTYDHDVVEHHCVGTTCEDALQDTSSNSPLQCVQRKRRW
jgi:hypothetical protein